MVKGFSYFFVLISLVVFFPVFASTRDTYRDLFVYIYKYRIENDVAMWEINGLFRVLDIAGVLIMGLAAIIAVIIFEWWFQKPPSFGVMLRKFLLVFGIQVLWIAIMRLVAWVIPFGDSLSVIGISEIILVAISIIAIILSQFKNSNAIVK